MKKEDARMFADKIIPEFRLVHDFVMQPRKVYIYKSIVYVIVMEVISVGLVCVLGYWWIPVIGLIAGMIIDIWHIGIGCLIAWVIWFVMFILLLMDRHKREG